MGGFVAARRRKVPVASACGPAVLTLCGALITTSCGESPIPTAPTAPTPAPVATAAPPPALVAAHLRGTVREEGDMPVSFARISVGQASAITEVDGSFDVLVSVNPQAQPLGFAWVNIEKPGYERSSDWALLRSASFPPSIEDTWKYFRLYRIREITAGESLRIAVAPDDPVCGFEGEWACRTIRLRSWQAGTVTVEAVPEDSNVLFGLVLAGVYRYPYRSTSRLSIAVAAGSATPIEILLETHPSVGPQGVTLHTSISP